MYKIGEFSNITKLSVKTLRYYDEAEILVPAARDESNGYRLYTREDYEKASLISLLRDFDFSIKEIKDVLINYEDERDLPYFIQEKRDMIEKRILGYQKMQKRMDKYIEDLERGVGKMDYKIEIKGTEQMLIASTRYKGKYEDVGEYFGKLFSTVKMKANGVPFNLYYDQEFKEDGADIEACVPIKSEVKGEGIITRVLEKRKVLYTIHIGSYETIGQAYKALIDYAKENSISYEAPSREIYHKGPGMLLKGNPNKYRTEIQFLIK